MQVEYKLVHRSILSHNGFDKRPTKLTPKSQPTVSWAYWRKNIPRLFYTTHLPFHWAIIDFSSWFRCSKSLSFLSLVFLYKPHIEQLNQDDILKRFPLLLSHTQYFEFHAAEQRLESQDVTVLHNTEPHLFLVNRALSNYRN